MAYDPITTNEIQSGEPVLGPVGFGQKVKDNLAYLYSQISSSGESVPNGSFEVDADSDGIPDNWTENLYPSGTFTLDTTDPAHAAKCAKFTHPGGAGNGGGYLDSDYISADDINPNDYFISFLHRSSAAGMKNIVEIRCYDKAKAYLSTITAYYSTANPTAWKKFQFYLAFPAGTAYVKIRVIGGYTDTDVAGDAYFDKFEFGLLKSGPFQISGNSVGLMSIPANGSKTVQSINFDVMPYQMLYVKHVRFDLISDDFRLQVEHPGYSSWQSTYLEDDIKDLNFLLADNSASAVKDVITVQVRIKNTTGGALNTAAGSGWWVDLR